MQLTISLPVAIYKFALVVAAVFPCISTKTMWFALLVRALVVVTVLEVLLAFTVFQAVEEFTFVDVVFVFAQADTLLSAVGPLSFIAVSVETSPDAISMFSTCLPLSLIDLPIIPLKSPFAFSQIIAVISSIDPIIGQLTAL